MLNLLFKGSKLLAVFGLLSLPGLAMEDPQPLRRERPEAAFWDPWEDWLPLELLCERGT